MMLLCFLFTDTRGSGTLWCFFSGQYQTTSRSFWCSWAYLPLGINVLWHHAPATTGMLICNMVFYFIMFLVDLLLKTSDFSGGERYRREESDFLSWGWLISGSWNRLWWDCFWPWKSWRGWFNTLYRVYVALPFSGLCMLECFHPIQDSFLKITLKNRRRLEKQPDIYSFTSFLTSTQRFLILGPNLWLFCGKKMRFAISFQGFSELNTDLPPFAHIIYSDFILLDPLMVFLV